MQYIAYEVLGNHDLVDDRDMIPGGLIEDIDDARGLVPYLKKSFHGWKWMAVYVALLNFISHRVQQGPSASSIMNALPQDFNVQLRSRDVFHDALRASPNTAVKELVYLLRSCLGWEYEND